MISKANISDFLILSREVLQRFTDKELSSLLRSCEQNHYNNRFYTLQPMLEKSVLPRETIAKDG